MMLDVAYHNLRQRKLRTLLKILGAAIPIEVLASLLPAWQALRVDPLEALRSE